MTKIIPNTTGIQVLTWLNYKGEAIFGFPLPIIAWRVRKDGSAAPISCDPLRGEYALLMPSGEVILPDHMKFENVAAFQDWMREEAKDKAA